MHSAKKVLTVSGALDCFFPKQFTVRGSQCFKEWASFHLSPGWVLVVGFPAGLSPTCFHLSPGSFHLSPRLGACMFLSIGHEAFLFICLPGPSLLVPCSISIHLFFRSVTGGVRPFPLAMQHFYSFVPQACHWWCPPFSTVSIHLSQVCHCQCFVSQVCHCWCRPFSSAMQHFYSLVSQVCLFRWRCNISIHLFSRSVTAGVRPFPLGMQHF